MSTTSESTESTPSSPAPASATGMLQQMISSIKGGKRHKKRSTRKRGGACGASTGAFGASVAGLPGQQTTVPGSGNMMSYKGGKKGGSLTAMAVPVVLLVSDMYASKLISTFKGMGIKSMTKRSRSK